MSRRRHFVVDSEATLHLTAERGSGTSCFGAVGVRYCKQLVWATGHLSTDTGPHSAAGKW